jgi:putative FmdB family regulatory protein
MPIYEYQCSACGHQLETIQKMSDKPLTDCPECHKPALNKLVSAAGFQLKGTGWYVTDYSAKGKSKATQQNAAEGGANTDGAKTQTADAATDNKTKDETSKQKESTTTKSSSSDSGATS